MTTIDDKTLSLTPGRRIELFDVDLTPYDGPILRFTPAREDVTPATVRRYQDMNAAAIGRLFYDISAQVDDGDTVLFEFYLRTNSGNTKSVMGVSGDASALPGSAFVRFGYDPAVLTTDFVQGGAYGSGHARNITLAGEYAFCTGCITIADATSVRLMFEPQGNLASDQGTCDMFGFRCWKRYGGTMIPILGPERLDDWSTDVAVSVTPVANTAEAIKVPVWGGNTYTPIPIRAEGFEKTGQGKFPRPKLSFSNITGAGSQVMQQYGDIRGAQVTRTRMYADNLDNGLDPDALASYAPDVFRILRRSQQNRLGIEFELGSVLDQQGARLPARQVLRDVCPWRYRAWNANTAQFDYATGDDGCPYTGSAYFDINGNTTADPAEDKCSQKLGTGCRARFGTSAELPFGGFPMVGRWKA